MEVPMKLREIGLAAIIATTNAIPALAHHSFATFDADRMITLEGIVNDFQWTNPHSWLLLTVSDARGRLELWTIELGAPSSLVRNGWVPKTIKPGMKVQAVIHPLRDGTPGGQFITVILPDGSQLGNQNGVTNRDTTGALQ
jgi:Family of unknown function (DUF6152)